MFRQGTRRGRADSGRSASGAGSWRNMAVKVVEAASTLPAS